MVLVDGELQRWSNSIVLVSVILKIEGPDIGIVLMW